MVSPLTQARRAISRSLVIALLGLVVLSCGPSPDVAIPESAQTMQFESAAFDPNGMIPPIYTCDGDDISPPLSWDTPPAETQSLALIVDDPDAPLGTFVHWVVYNMSPDQRGLPEAVPPDETLSKGGFQGKNDFRNIGYGGPCPPSGTHRYFFKLYALDAQLDVPPGATKADVMNALNGHILAYTELVGQYSRS